MAVLNQPHEVEGGFFLHQIHQDISFGCASGVCVQHVVCSHSFSQFVGGRVFFSWVAGCCIWKKSVRNIDLYSLYSADSFIATP